MKKSISKIKICAPVIGDTLPQFLANLKKAEKKADLVELRVDFIQGFQIADILAIKKKLKAKAIFTCRAKYEGGAFAGSEKKRIKIIEKALELGFDYVDIELKAIAKADLKNKSKRTKIICSRHDFAKTPSFKALENIARKMRAQKCDIIKIATKANKEEDINNLLKLLANKGKSQKMIALGMGEKAKIVRILAPFLGGYLTFASLGRQKTAPGQIEIGEMRRIYKAIN